MRLARGSDRLPRLPGPRWTWGTLPRARRPEIHRGPSAGPSRGRREYPSPEMAGRSRHAAEVVLVEGREISISNPGKVLFPEPGYTKLDLVRYYLAVAEGALRGAGGRPTVLVRYPDGIGGEFFYQ